MQTSPAKVLREQRSSSLNEMQNNEDKPHRIELKNSKKGLLSALNKSKVPLIFDAT